jgi:hypothetical protein
MGRRKARPHLTGPWPNRKGLEPANLVSDTVDDVIRAAKRGIQTDPRRELPGSATDTSRTWCRPFLIAQCPRTAVREPGRAGLLEGEAADCVHGHGRSATAHLAGPGSCA